MDIRTSALADVHVRSGATMTTFSGWRMPVRFSGTLVEHAAVRDDVGVFDVSHLGTIWIRGKGAREVIDATFSNDPRTLADGQAQYTLCCNGDGGVIDDLIVYRVTFDRWLAIPNAANHAKVLALLEDQANSDTHPVIVEDADHAVLAVQGPNAFVTLERALTAAGVRSASRLEDCGAFELVELSYTTGTGDNEPGFAATTGYTGELGAELVVPQPWAPTLWQALHEAGATQCGLGARDTLRLEMGYPLHGNEIDEQIDPFVAGLGWVVKLTDRRFVGSDVLAKLKAQPPRQHTVGIVVAGRRPVRSGMGVSADGRSVGLVTSGTFSPTLGRPIALARVDTTVVTDDTVVVDVRGTEVEATVVRPPFIRR